MQKSHHDRDEVRRLLAQRKAEKLTFQELVDLSGIPIHVFQHRARQDDITTGVKASTESGFVEVIASSPGLATPNNSTGIELLLPHGVRVHLAPDFDTATLTRLLASVPC
ncbi:MAG: hypothetical protein ACI835_005923 [Planctomycetota bacterium]|jgi:hypothetical protein